MNDDPKISTRERSRTENKVFCHDIQAGIKESIEGTERSPVKSLPVIVVLRMPKNRIVADGYLIPERRLVQR